LSHIPELAAPIRKALGDSTPPSIQFKATNGAFTAVSLAAVHEAARGIEEEYAGQYEEALKSFRIRQIGSGLRSCLFRDGS